MQLPNVPFGGKVGRAVVRWSLPAIDSRKAYTLCGGGRAQGGGVGGAGAWACAAGGGEGGSAAFQQEPRHQTDCRQTVRFRWTVDTPAVDRVCTLHVDCRQSEDRVYASRGLVKTECTLHVDCRQSVGRVQTECTLHVGCRQSVRFEWTVVPVLRQKSAPCTGSVRYRYGQRREATVKRLRAVEVERDELSQVLKAIREQEGSSAAVKVRPPGPPNSPFLTLADVDSAQLVRTTSRRRRACSISPYAGLVEVRTVDPRLVLVLCSGVRRVVQGVRHLAHCGLCSNETLLSPAL
eukprot:1196023-Prorocentrum_minimum.AAC.1